MDVLYDLETGRQIATLAGDWGTTSIDYSADGKRLASASLSGSTTIWNVEQQAKIAQLSGPVTAYAVRYSPNGKRIAVGDSSGVITLWEIAPSHRFSVPGETLAPAHRIGQLRGQDGPVHAIDFNRSGSRLVSLSDDGQLRLWDVTTRKLIGAPLPGANTAGTALFFPDGKHILAAFQTGTAIVWNVDPRAWDAQACSIARRNLTRAEWIQFVGNRSYRPTCS
jgi:WD40 repeat protein